MSKKTVRNLILGYGFLGQNLYRYLSDDNTYVLSRSVKQPGLTELHEQNSRVWDLNDKATWQSLSALDDDGINLFFLLPPSKIDLNLFSDFVSFLKDLNINKAILTSSTVVYGKTERTVSAESDVNADSGRARRQLAIEEAWLTLADVAHVVRLAGLYGAGRVIGKQRLLDNKAIHSDPDALLNLIHVDDASRLLVAVKDSPLAAPIELGCDEEAVSRRDYYQTLAKLLKTNAPLFKPEALTHNANRQCNNQTSCERLGWQAEYKSYLSGLKQSLGLIT